MVIRPRLLVVTSQYSIPRIWENCLESRQALDRRFVSINKLARDELVLGGYSSVGADCDSSDRVLDAVVDMVQEGGALPEVEIGTQESIDGDQAQMGEVDWEDWLENLANYVP